MKVFYKDGFCEVADVDPASAHFRYGAGFFETMLYDGNEIKHLEKHLSRIINSSEHFGFEIQNFDYDTVLKCLIDENQLSGSTARINICHMALNPDSYAVFASASPYTPPPVDKVFKLCFYPHVHDSYLSIHKTMNYMHFMLAKKYAAQYGCDDCILLDSENRVLETSTAALIFSDGNSFYVSDATAKLRSISLEIFAESNNVTSKPVTAENISRFDIYVTNSLMGIRKAVLS